MLIQEYAERIYTSPSIAEKLLCPGRLEDPAQPHRPWTTYGPPARPQSLGLRADGERPRLLFPKLHELEDDTRRGHALHFFANHELLALELMALMLLRFPEADPAFRKTLANTMQDEQRHLKLYLDRMEELGIGFGEIPVNSFFYNHIANVNSVQDFVVRMSLTFEQANLDFSLFYAKAFEEIGDSATQAIMEEVLHDEIAHVAHGVRWFNEWRDGDLSMWDAYRQGLNFPLTPARAKGLSFYRGPRRKAGLPEDFIDRLRVYNHSKGRTPDVWIFNPDSEDQLAHPDGGYVPKKAVASMQRDLRTLPMFLAKQDDVILVDESPCPQYLNEMLDLGFAIPEFVEADLERPRLPKRHELVGRTCANLRPWGWNPRIDAFLSPLAPQAPPTCSAPSFSKAWFAERYAQLVDTLPFEEFCVLDPAPFQATSVEAALTKVEALFESGFPMVIIKSPWGASGQRNIRLRPGEPNEKQAIWMQRTLSVQGSLVVEGFFDKVIDLSFQFDVGKETTFRSRGLTRPMTDQLGRFRGLFVTRPLKDLETETRDFAFRATGDPKWLEKTLTELGRRCADELRAQGYTGPAGIDAMLVRDQGGLRLRPLVEVNVRFTMGRIALALADHVAPGRSSVWCMLGERDLKTAQRKDFSEALKAMRAHLSTELLEGRSPKIRRGVVATNCPSTSKHVLTLLLVADSREEILAALSGSGFEGLFPI